MALGEYTYLSKGMKGTAVKEMQEDLLKLGFKLPQFGADSDFGSETEIAVRNFQYTYALPVTGVIDQNSANVIKNALTSDYAALGPQTYPTTTLPIAAPAVLPKPSVSQLPGLLPAGIDWKWIGLGFVGVLILFYYILPMMKKEGE